jgi:hypothetical protein
MFRAGEQIWLLRRSRCHSSMSLPPASYLADLIGIMAQTPQDI